MQKPVVLIKQSFAGKFLTSVLLWLSLKYVWNVCNLISMLLAYKPNDNWFNANIFVGTAVHFIIIFQQLWD